jgi:hypothetical protein
VRGAPHLGDRLRLRDQVQVERRVHPRLQRRQVRDRRDERHARVDPRQQRVDPGIRGHDHVRALGRDQPPQAAPAEQHPEALLQAPGPVDLDDEHVGELEEHDVRAAHHDPLDERPHRLQRVGHRHLRAALAQPGRELAGGQVVALADRGREDQDARHVRHATQGHRYAVLSRC